MMTKEQIDAIDADIRAYVKRKEKETGEDYFTITVAISSAILQENVNRTEKRLIEIGFFNKVLSSQVTDFSFSDKVLKHLDSIGVKTVRELVRHDKAGFLRLRLADTETINEIDRFLTRHHLRWGMGV